MPFAILPLLQWLGGAFWSFASSRMGQIIIAFTVAWFWAGGRADEHWRAVIAAEKAAAEAAYRAEVARQAQAAVEIAAAATARAEEDQAVEDALRRQIAEFDSKEKVIVAPQSSAAPKYAPNACAIDNNFAGVVRRLDAAGARKTKPSRRSR